MVIELIAPWRVSDSWGQGQFGAPRAEGKRLHMGQDYAAAAGSILLSPVQGLVTKLGYPYQDDLRFRYLEITNGAYRHRFFYVEPDVVVGDVVDIGTELGVVQNIVERYFVPRGMTNHIHYEIKNAAGEYVNPEEST